MTTEKEIYVGAVVEINQKQINLVPNTPINKIDERGLKLALDKPLELGEFGKAMGSICTDLGVKNDSLRKGKFPKTNVEILDKVTTKIEKANITIEALEYNKPPKTAENNETKYLFVASVNWKEDNQNQNGDSPNKENNTDFFKLKGLILGISSGYTDSENGENTGVQKAFQSALQAMNVPALPPSVDVEAKQIEAEANNKLEKPDHRDQEATDTSSDESEEQKTASTEDSK